MTISLAFLAPDLVKAAIKGRLPDASSVRVVTRRSANSPREDRSTSSAILLISIGRRS
jgi:hypothetical protein